MRHALMNSRFHRSPFRGTSVWSCLALGLLTVVLAAGVASAAAPATDASPSNATDNDTGELAPGLAADGVTDPLALAQAHNRVLRNASYTVTTTFSHRYRNGTLLGTSSSTTLVAADGEFVRRTYGTLRNGSGPLAVTQYDRRAWSNGTLTLTATRFGDGAVEYERDAAPAVHRLRPDTEWETVYAVLSAVNTTVVGEVERDGTTLYRVVATDVRPRSGHADDRPFTMTALVDERGVVHELVVAHPTTYQGRPAFVTQTVRVTNVGNTTVERPPWLDEALGNATGSGA